MFKLNLIDDHKNDRFICFIRFHFRGAHNTHIILTIILLTKTKHLKSKIKLINNQFDVKTL